MRTPIGPRWLTWLILLYGVLEIPWVIFLMFFQQRTGTAENPHLAVAGLAIAGIVASVATVVGLLSSQRWTAVAAVLTATVLATWLFFAAVLSEVGMALGLLPGILAGIVVAASALRGREVSRVWVVVLGLVAVFLLFRLGLAAAATTTSLNADHLRFLIVVYDSAEVAALLGLGLCLRRGAQRAAIVFGAAGVVLFAVDAWINVTVVDGGPALIAALVYAVVGEFPSIAMCAAGTWFALKRWQPPPPMPVKIGT